MEKNIRLIGAYTVGWPPISMASCARAFFCTSLVEINNLCGNKNLFAFGRNFYSNKWEKISGKFLYKANGNIEIWKCYLNNVMSICELYFTCTCDNEREEYLDNNDNNNYHFDPYDLSGWIRKTVLLTKLRKDGTGWVFVKNISFEKKIRIVYTFDNWQNKHEVFAKYMQTLVHTDIEIWYFTILNLDENNREKTELAIEYSHKDGIDWDNNYGLNYKLTHYNRLADNRNFTMFDGDKISYFNRGSDEDYENNV